MVVISTMSKAGWGVVRWQHRPPLRKCKFKTYRHGCQGKDGGRIVREFGMDIYTVLYLKWITNKDLLYSTGNSARCYMAARVGGSLGENGYTYMYGKSLCCLPETITLSIRYSPLQNKKSSSQN